MTFIVSKADDGRVWVGSTDETGDGLVSSVRGKDGSWTSGKTPAPDDLKDNFSRVRDYKEAEVFIQEARKAAALFHESAAMSLAKNTPLDPGGVLLDSLSPSTDLMSNILDNTDVDFLFVVVGREEVEACNPTEVLKTLKKLTANKATALKFMGKVDIRVHGYDDDPRELFEIPEVRLFFRELDQQFPFWFFFLSTETGALTLLALLLCRVTRLSPTTSDYNHEDFTTFINSQLAAMNHVFDSFQIGEEVNEQRSHELAQYFLKSIIRN